MERLPPKPSIIKALFAKSGNECAFPGCDQALVDERNLFVGEVCHIRAVKDGEARYDPSISDEECRAYENLILLCHAHHVRIDSLPEEYTVVTLTSMRESHERSVEKSVYNVSDTTVDDALYQLLQADWQPEFESVIDYIVADIKEARSGQQGMNRAARLLSQIQDAALHLALLKALTKMTLSERRRALREHRRWQEQREQAAYEASLEMEGGSGAKGLYWATYAGLTEDRIKSLSKPPQNDIGT